MFFLLSGSGVWGFKVGNSGMGGGIMLGVLGIILCLSLGGSGGCFLLVESVG